MSLLKQISEDITAYNDFVATILDKVVQFETELEGEKRLGLAEADYYQQDKSGQPNKDSLDFKPSPEIAAVKKPVQQQQAPQSPQNKNIRIHIIFDPATGKVMNAAKSGPFERPSSDYVEADEQQMQAALKHIERINPQIADRIMSGSVGIWVPKAAQAPKPSDMMQKQHSGMNTMNLSPDKLAQAHAAADKMSFA